MALLENNQAFSNDAPPESCTTGRWLRWTPFSHGWSRHGLIGASATSLSIKDTAHILTLLRWSTYSRDSAANMQRIVDAAGDGMRFLSNGRDPTKADVERFRFDIGENLAGADELAALIPDPDLLRAYQGSSGKPGDAAADLLSLQIARRGLDV